MLDLVTVSFFKGRVAACSSAPVPSNRSLRLSLRNFVHPCAQLALTTCRVDERSRVVAQIQT